MAATRSGSMAAARVRNVTGVSAAKLARVGGKVKSPVAVGFVRFGFGRLRVLVVAIIRLPMAVADPGTTRAAPVSNVAAGVTGPRGAVRIASHPAHGLQSADAPRVLATLMRPLTGGPPC